MHLENNTTKPHKMSAAPMQSGGQFRWGEKEQLNSLIRTSARGLMLAHASGCKLHAILGIVIQSHAVLEWMHDTPLRELNVHRILAQ